MNQEALTDLTYCLKLEYFFSYYSLSSLELCHWDYLTFNGMFKMTKSVLCQYIEIDLLGLEDRNYRRTVKELELIALQDPVLFMAILI